jgi:secreted trypsin-like serine protease
MPLRLLFVLAAALLGLAAPAHAIVGGQPTQRAWPHMAALEHFAAGPGGEEWAFTCGASLVRQDVVLTAAHCIEDDSGDARPASRFRLLLGTRRRSSGGERIAAAEVRIHPQWKSTGTYDVALLKLARPASLGSPIALAAPADAPRWEPGDVATIIGWGADASTIGDVKDDLHEGDVTVRGDAECSTFNPGLRPATEVCAGEPMGGRDSCQGDSGGPLMVPGATAPWVQVGVVSYGLGCAFPTQYGVYAEVGNDPLRSWVQQNASAMSTAPASSGGPAPTGAAGGGGPAGSPAGARLRLPARLGSARRARRRGRLTVVLRTTAPVRAIRMTLRRIGRTVAAGRRASLRRARGRVVLRVRPGLRAGRATLRVRARDGAGRRLAAARRVRVRR